MDPCVRGDDTKNQPENAMLPEEFEQLVDQALEELPEDFK